LRLAGSPFHLSQHPNQHRPEHPILLAVDQELGEGATLRKAPELSDSVGPLEVGEHEDVEQLGAGSGTEGVQALPESALEFIGSYQGIGLRRLLGDGVDGMLKGLALSASAGRGRFDPPPTFLMPRSS
jgi:hypothetical protein